MPGLVDIHSHPSTEPSYRGLREDHGVPEQYMTGLHERSQAFRLGADGKKAATRDGLRRDAGPAASPRWRTCRCQLAGWTDATPAPVACGSTPPRATARWLAGGLARSRASPGSGMRRPGAEQGLRRHPRAILEELDAWDPSGRLKGVVYPLQIDTVTRSCSASRSLTPRRRAGHS